MLSSELKKLVHDSVAILGEVIRHELGARAFGRIETLRAAMAGLRGASTAKAHRVLSRELERMRHLSLGQRLEIARSFTLMLELMNACENAYRSHRLRAAAKPWSQGKPATMIYVLTAHPTEARTPVSIELFHKIQAVLESLLLRKERSDRDRLKYLLLLAWHTRIAPARRPRVKDEAEHLYSIALRDESLSAILRAREEFGPIYLRSWVGADKDGHPRVGAPTLRQSLQTSRNHLRRFAAHRLSRVGPDLPKLGLLRLGDLHRSAVKDLASTSIVRPGDGTRMQRLRSSIRLLDAEFERAIGFPHPDLSSVRALLRIFPALVIPLELRESAELIPRGPTIRKMLLELGRIARGCDPLHYARGLVVSMTQSFEDLKAAEELIASTLGEGKIPAIPLFEQEQALRDAPRIVKRMLEDRRGRRGYFEIMVGYSDSAKEFGVLPSRLRIMDAILRVDRLLKSRPVVPVYFHGSGGSSDRGGGSIEEQTRWWPLSSLRVYKTTIQGEMVERTFASPEIIRRRFEQIALRALGGASDPGPRRSSIALEAWASEVERCYRQTVSAPGFPELIRSATLYPYLQSLRIGSRPPKRQTGLSGLRAIPWVLCWTQARVLFPTWWGAGSAWRGSRQKAELRRCYEDVPLFRSYVHTLGATLAKVELPVWRLHLERSGLPGPEIESIFRAFFREWEDACRCVRYLTGQRDLVGHKPWLGESIRLRSPMIHPLNLLQLVAMEREEPLLLRETVTGISSGMMTTG